LGDVTFLWAWSNCLVIWV